MNTKLTVKAQNGKTLRCVLSNDANLENQLEKMLHADGGGLCVRIEYGEIRVVDYFHNETVGAFKILSKEDTEETVSLKWTEI